MCWPLEFMEMKEMGLKFMKDKMLLLLSCLIAFSLIGCGVAVKKYDASIEYRNSSYNFDEKNKTIPIEGYELNQMNPYDTVETENGIDIIFHLNKKLGSDN